MAVVPLLAYAFTLDHPPRVRQRLHVYADGQVWYWATLPGNRVGGGAGTYADTLDAADLASVEAIASALVAAPVPAVGIALPVFGVIEATVVASSDGAERTHVYRLGAGADLAPALRDAADLASRLIAAAEAAPVAAIRLDAAAQRPLPDRGQRGTLRFAFANVGTQPVSFTVAPDSLRAQRRSGDSWQEVWRLGGEPLLGLVGTDGESLDGLLIPATLAPGATASLVFIDALDMPTSGATGGDLRGMAGGTIALRQPAATAAGGRAAAFEPYRVLSD